MATPTIETSIPRPSAQPLEVDYLQNRLEDDQYANTAFDVEKQQFVPQKQTAALRSVSFDLLPEEDHDLQVARTTQSFKNAIEILKKKKGKEKAISKFSFDGATSWNDINQIMKTAEIEYLDEDSASGKIRKFFRRIGSNGKSIQSFVGLLPDGNYKTLCGGITLVLKAMTSHAEIREKMAELMEELPEDVDDCGDYSRIYHGRAGIALKRSVEELYMNILAALEDFVRWYMQGTLRHVRDSLLKNQDYGQSIDIRIREIRKSRLRFQSMTRKLMHRTLQLAHGTGLDTNQRVQSSQATLTKIEESVDDAKRGVGNAQFALLRRMSGLQSEVVNGVQKVLADHTKNAKWQKEVDVLRQEVKDKDAIIAKLRSRMNDISYTPISLAEVLRLELSDTGQQSDIDEVFSKGSKETPHFQDRSRWVAESQEFLRWIDSNKSEIIAIEAHGELESVSANSFLVALLLPKLVESNNVLVLPFFCGLHTGSRFQDSGEPSGPLLMARALLTQILDVSDNNDNDGLPLLSLKPEQMKKLRGGSFSAYVRLISFLIGHLSERFAAIFIIVDGLDYYDLHWEKEARYLVKSLCRLAAAGGPGVLKIMLTAATHFGGAWKREGKGIVSLDIPDEMDGESEIFEELSLE